MMTVRGLFPEIAVTGAVDIEDPENSSIEAVIQTASIRTHTRPGTTTSAPPTVWESKLLGAPCRSRPPQYAAATPTGRAALLGLAQPPVDEAVPPGVEGGPGFGLGDSIKGF